MRSLIAICLSLGSLTGVGTSQTTWVVDWRGGTGSHFRDLAEAIEAAQIGDRIYVRPGSSASFATYYGKPIDKGITIVGQGMPKIAHLEVSGLPAGQTVTLQGVTGVVDAPFSRESVLLRQNAGLVVLEDVTGEGGPYGFSFPFTGRALIEDCTAVAMTRCSLEGDPGLEVLGSTVALTSCSIDGYDFAMPRSFSPAGIAVRADRSVLIVADTTWTGGDGHTGSPLGGPAPPALAARLSETTVLFAGVGSNTVAAGPGPAQFPMPALDVTGGSITVQGVAFRVNGASPAVVGSTQSLSTFVPALDGTGATLGGNLQASLFGEVGGGGAFLIGRPAAPTLLGLGRLWLDPAGIVVLSPGVFGPSRRLLMSVRVPLNSALLYQSLGVQGLVASPQGVLALSNPLHATVR